LDVIPKPSREAAELPTSRAYAEPPLIGRST